MIKRQAGFTLIELMVTMVLFILTIVAATNIFVPLLTTFKQQSTLAESNIEGMIGLDILRRDIELAGYGIPFFISPDITTASYTEASNATSGGIPAPDTYNDAPNAPRALINDPGVMPGGSDYFVIKSTAVATNDAAGKWSDVVGTGGGNGTAKSWGNAYDEIADGERAVVIIPYRSVSGQRILVNDGNSFTVSFKKGDNAFPIAYSPAIAGETYLIYGVDSDTDLRMPFNRADYFIRRTGTVPTRCAKGNASADNTGVLMKSVIEHASGDRGNGIPLLDCVADFQVVFNSGGGWTSVLPSLPDLNDRSAAQQIREDVTEVRVYILAHEGQFDPGYEYPNATICVGEQVGAVCNNGRDFDLTLMKQYKNYRWKIYSLAVQPKNLR